MILNAGHGVSWGLKLDVMGDGRTVKNGQGFSRIRIDVIRNVLCSPDSSSTVIQQCLIVT